MPTLKKPAKKSPSKKTVVKKKSPSKKTAPPAFLEAAKTSSKNQGREKFTVNEMIEAISLNGTISGASKALDCSRQTVAKYMEMYPEIQEAVNEARETMIDIAEGGLMANIADKHPASIFFVLKTLGKDRGYVDRTETTGANGAPLDTDVKVTFVNASNKDD